MDDRRAKSRHGAVALRLRALLAGALVLGVGSSVTLASWTDSDFATGSFGASSFQTESNVTKPYDALGAWSTNEQSAGALVFEATAMSPGKVVYAPIAIRTKATSVSGEVVLGIPSISGNSAAGDADLSAALRYRVIRSATCGASSFTGTPAFVVGSDGAKPLTVGQEPGVVNPLQAATATLPGAPTQFCFEVTLPAGASNALQGQKTTATWQFTATSSS